jgi:hypothetical protein
MSRPFRGWYPAVSRVDEQELVPTVHPYHFTFLKESAELRRTT